MKEELERIKNKYMTINGNFPPQMVDKMLEQAYELGVQDGTIVEMTVGELKEVLQPYASIINPN